VGMFTPWEGGPVRNTFLFTGPAGTEADLHEGTTKITLSDAFGFAESDTADPGDPPRSATAAGIAVGLSICYDIRFPGQFRALAADGAQVTLCIASWGAGPGKVEQWRLLAGARALDATTFLVAVGQADPAEEGVEVKRGAPTGVGHSLLA